MSRPGGVKDSHPLNTTETGDKYRLYEPFGSERTQLKLKCIRNLVTAKEEPEKTLRVCYGYIALTKSAISLFQLFYLCHGSSAGVVGKVADFQPRFPHVLP